MPVIIPKTRGGQKKDCGVGKKNIDAIILPHLISLHVNTPCREEQYDDIHFLLFTFHPIFLPQVYLYIRNYIQLGFLRAATCWAKNRCYCMMWLPHMLSLCWLLCSGKRRQNLMWRPVKESDDWGAKGVPSLKLT